MATKVFLIFAAFSFTSAGIIDPKLKQKLSLGGEGTKNVLISFSEDIQTIFDKVNSMDFADDNEKRTVQTDMQKQFSETVQGPLRNFLETQGIKSDSFWISNSMIVDNVDSVIINAIANFPGVEMVEEVPIVQLGVPAAKPVGEVSRRFTRQGAGMTWGLRKIRAKEAWDLGYNGQDVVVAGIDTGVRWTHEALKGNFRSSYNWFDPYDSTTEPWDSHGHGSHIQGTICGTNGIGVAPSAQWIHCRGCHSVFCEPRQLLQCGQWIQCPTLPDGSNSDCSKAPQVVSNSWGSMGPHPWYNNVIKSWNATGIIPVYANGNEGPNCDTAYSPADRNLVIGVGSMEQSDMISWFSSLGPAGDDGRIKPDIAAPGGAVISASHESDTGYTEMSGTSMACPHVSGVVALMKQKNANARFQQIYDAIINNAVTSVETSTAPNCGGKPGNQFPNNVFGYGRIDAVNCVNANF